MCVVWKPSHLLMNCTVYLMETRSINRWFCVCVFFFFYSSVRSYVNCATFMAVFMFQCEHFTCFYEVLQPFDMQWMWNGMASHRMYENISTCKILKTCFTIDTLAILILSLFHWANKSFGMKMWFYLSASSEQTFDFFSLSNRSAQ